VNAVSPALMQDVLAALDALEAREATRCIVLTGSGTKAFSAGADLAAARAPRTRRCASASWGAACRSRRNDRQAGHRRHSRLVHRRRVRHRHGV